MLFKFALIFDFTVSKLIAAYHSSTSFLVGVEKINLRSALYQSISRFFHVMLSFTYSPNSLSKISVKIFKFNFTYFYHEDDSPLYPIEYDG